MGRVIGREGDAMKNIYLLAALLVSGGAVAAEAPTPTVKICASWINRKAGHCLTDYQSHALPGATLYGITEYPAETNFPVLEHSWNGAAPDRVIKIEKGRVLVSQLKGGAGEGKTVRFKVSAPGGKVIADRSVDVRWQANRMMAQEIDPAKPLVPEGVADPERPVPAGTGTTTEAPYASAGGTTGPFFLKRAEIHAAYLWDRGGNGSLSAIPTWSPEWRSPAGYGVGARLGATFWKDARDDSYFAFEGDVHAVIPVRLGEHSLKLEPALGLHAWADRGFAISPGVVAEAQFFKFPFTVLAGFHIWKQQGLGQRLVTLGVGREF